MFKNLVIAVAAGAFFAACGVPSDATVGGQLAGEPEVSGEGQELTSSRADAWLPLAEGNRWELTSKTSSKTIEVQYFQNDVALITGLLPTDLWVGLAPSTPNSLYAWDDSAQKWNTMIRFGYAATPWKWSTSGTCRSFDAHRSATGVKVSTPAGDFTDTRVISFSQIAAPNVRCEHPAFTEIAFAAKVGIVSLSSGPDVFVLKSAKVGSKSYPAASGVSVKVRSDVSSYVNLQNTIRCITTPCPSNEKTAVATFTMTVTNTTTQTQKLTWNTGKQFDFELIDSSGKTVAAYSDGRIYTMALAALSLAPGESHEFVGQMPLKDRDSNQLQGSYTVHGIVPVNSLGSVQGPLEATSTISVSIQ